MNTVPNLDCMSREELWAFWEKHRHGKRKESLELIGDTRKGYTTLAMTLAAYACNKATAMKCRGEGLLEAAQVYEKICDNMYDELPKDLKW